MLAIIKALAILATIGTAFADDSVSDADVSSIAKFQSASFGTTLGSTCGCTILTALFWGKVHYPGSATYQNETTYYWDLKETLAPKCVFIPTSSNDIAKGVVALNVCQSQFAVRAGGHMPVKGSANSDGGILLVLTNFRSNDISADKKTVTSGSGQGWVEVYTALEPYGLYAIGGRLKTIGVGGLTLGGGLNYLANKYGLTADTVVAYEIVLSTGKIVTASAQSNKDLFWALKGGSGNFGIVTKFTLAVYPIPQVSGAITVCGEDQLPAFTKAVADIAKYQTTDVVGGGFFTITYDVTTGASTLSAVGIQTGTVSPPPLFANFSAIPNYFSNYAVSTPLQWHSQFDTPYQTARRLFSVRSMRPDAAQMAEVFRLYKAAIQDIKDVAGLSTVLVYQPIPTSIAAVAKNNGIGNVLGVTDAEPFIWWQINAFWTNTADDARMESWVIAIREKIHAINAGLGLAADQIYLNDANGDQKPYDAIPAANLAKLKSVRSKYDPTLVFTKLVNGGFKF